MLVNFVLYGLLFVVFTSFGADRQDIIQNYLFSGIPDRKPALVKGIRRTYFQPQVRVSKAIIHDTASIQIMTISGE